MKEYIVRLRDYNGSIIDGEFYTAENEIQAELKYMQRLIKLGIEKEISKYDYITVEQQ